MRPVALVACVALLTACFGYNSSAKKWAYAGDAVLILGGGAAIAGDELTKPAPCTGAGCPTYKEPLSGGLIAGIVLVSAGVFGILFNATRENVKTSR